MTRHLIDLAADAIARARRLGATAADAIAGDRVSTDVAVRDGAIEHLERSEAREVGLRVFDGERSATVAGSILDADGLERLAEMALAMARAAPPDPHAGLSDAADLAKDVPDLDLAAASLPDTAALKSMALAAEQGALAVEGVSKSDGASASASDRAVALVASNGFSGGYRRTGAGVSVSAIAGSGTAMERDYDFSSALHPGDLDDAAAVGRRAGERAARRRDPRKIASCRVPVVYEPRVASGLLGTFSSAISGSAVARGTSFLKDRMGRPVFAPGIAVVDDPTIRRGRASRPFDGEGLPSRPLLLVEDGVLKSWILDQRSARQLGLASNGRGARGANGPPGPSSTNLRFEKGAVSPEALIRETGRGLYVTELIGMGINMVTGDYSRGAGGFWIEDGELAYPVSEITVAGNLADMFAGLTLADDLVFRTATSAPTLRVAELTIAGR